MIDIDVKGDVKQVERWLNNTQRKKLPRAVSRALNKTVASARTEVKKPLAEQMGAKVSLVNDVIQIKKASPRYLVAEMVATGRPVSLHRFKRTSQAEAGVKSGAWGKSRVYSKSFLKGRGKKRGAYVRTSKKRYPIKRLWGPSVPKTFRSQAIRRINQRNARLVFAREMNRQLRRVL